MWTSGTSLSKRWYALITVCARPNHCERSATWHPSPAVVFFVCLYLCAIHAVSCDAWLWLVVCRVLVQTQSLKHASFTNTHTCCIGGSLFASFFIRAVLIRFWAGYELYAHPAFVMVPEQDMRGSYEAGTLQVFLCRSPDHPCSTIHVR
jgi:hypothetical protein